MLSVRDYQGVLDVLRRCAEAEDLEAFRHALLGATRDHLGYQQVTFCLGEHPIGRLALRDLAAVGVPQPLITRYFAHHAADDPFGGSRGRRLFRAHGMVSLAQVGEGPLSEAHEAYLADFLAPAGVTNKVMTWLDTGLAVHGYFNLLAVGERTFDTRDAEILETLRPHLAAMLRAHLRHTPPAASGELTARERQIARRVADGWPNRAISADLEISEGTVKKHLTHVLTKTGLRSRTELAALWRDDSDGKPRGSTGHRRGGPGSRSAGTMVRSKGTPVRNSSAPVTSATST